MEENIMKQSHVPLTGWLNSLSQ